MPFLQKEKDKHFRSTLIGRYSLFLVRFVQYVVFSGWKVVLIVTMENYFTQRTLAADEYPVLPMYEMERQSSLIMAPKIRLPVSMDINAFLNSAFGKYSYLSLSLPLSP